MRKHSFWICFLAFVFLTTVSCQNNKKNTPESVTEMFAKSYYTADFTHMYQYSTKKSDIIVQQLQNLMKDNAERMEEMRNCHVVIVETKVLEQTDSTATCSCAVKLNDKPREDKWDLIKENDEWKVTLVLP